MKPRLTLLALAVLLFVSSACRSTGAQAESSERVPVFRVAFFTPESTEGTGEALLAELEALLEEHAKPASMTSAQTPDKIEVKMHFADEQSCTNAGPPTAFAIQLFRAAHPDARYDNTPCNFQLSNRMTP